MKLIVMIIMSQSFCNFLFFSTVVKVIGLVYFFSLSNFVLVFLLWYQKPLLLLPYKFLVLFKTRDGKWCIASGYAIRFRPICVCQIGIVKCSLDCILVRQDSSNRHREGVMDCPFLFSFFVDL